MGNHSLHPGVFPIQELNLGLLNCRQFLYHLSHQGRPKQEVYGHWKIGVELATNSVCSAVVEQNTFLFVSKVYSLSIGTGAQNTVHYYITITTSDELHYPYLFLRTGENTFGATLNI